MGEHGVAPHVGGVARDKKPVMLDAVGHVIVLASPTPKLVTEPIDGSELVHCHGAHTSEDIIVR